MNVVELPVTVVIPGDLHLTDPDADNHRVALRVVDEVNGLIRPDFVQFIGDNVQDASEAQFCLFDELRGRLAVPHFALVGDHDVHDDPGAEGFRRHVGPTHGSTSLRGFRFLRLDTQQGRPLGLSTGQVAWFQEQVDGAAAAGERVVVFQHNYPYQIWETFDGPGVDGWRGVVQTRRVAAIVCGHTHYWQVANDGRNVAVAVRSVGDPEGGPPGYAVAHFGGDDLAVTYRAAGDPAPLVLVTHPRDRLFMTGPRQVVAGADRVRVRVWSGAGVDEVRGRVDGAAWFALDRGDGGDWSGPLAGDGLSKGGHDLEVEAVDGAGRVGRQAIRFLVDPTGRYTAVPGVSPGVERTDFC